MLIIFFIVNINLQANNINKKALISQLKNPYDISDARLFFCNNLIIPYYITLAKQPEELVFLCANYINNKDEFLNLFNYLGNEANFNPEDSDGAIEILPNNLNNNAF